MKLNLSTLNEDQLKVVTAEKGKHLVLAGAGTGKTTTLTYRAAYLIEKGMDPQNLLLLTFTNKAARNMMLKASSLISGIPGEINGGTFHSVANRALRTSGKFIGLDNNYSIIDTEDQRSLIKGAREEVLGKRFNFRNFPSPGDLLSLFSKSINTGVGLNKIIIDFDPELENFIKEILDVKKTYEKAKWGENCLDYDDLLVCWHSLLKDFPEGHKERFFYEDILVDEFQDTNRIQGEIIDLLCGLNDQNLMVVGDDCQSIFAFRGAVFQNILNFKDRHKETHMHYLTKNYRSTTQVLNVANQIIKKNKKQHHKELSSAYKNNGPYPKVTEYEHDAYEAQWIVQDIIKNYNEKGTYSEMAVLYRNHSHSAWMERELVKAGIPYEVRSGVRFFEKAHIKDITAHLKILNNIKDGVSWIRVIGICEGIGAVRSRKLIEEIKKSSKISDLGADFGKDILPKKAYETWKSFFKKLLYFEKLSNSEGSKVINLINAIAKDDGQYDVYMKKKYRKNLDTRKEEIGGLAGFSEGYSSLNRFLDEVILRGEDFALNVVSESEYKDRLVLSSIHQAKGLEWDLVWVIRATQASFCGRKNMTDDDLEEERRVLYVALTRAKTILNLTWPRISINWGSRVFNQECDFLKGGLHVEKNTKWGKPGKQGHQFYKGRPGEHLKGDGKTPSSKQLKDWEL